MKVFLNGALIEHEAARIDPADRGFTLGDGVFETIAIRKAAARRLPAHLARLRFGAAVLGIPLTETDETLTRYVTEVAAANGLSAAVVRMTLTRGPGGRGIVSPENPRPTLLLTAAPLPPEPEPARAIIAATRRNEFSPLARIKSLNYGDNIIARQEAIAAGADDAILLNIQGNVAEGTVGNVFLLHNGGLVTPRIEDGALPGIARAEVIKLTHAEEVIVTPEMLEKAGEIFFSNALGIRPVIALDHNPVGDGEPGLITQLVATRI